MGITVKSSATGETCTLPELVTEMRALGIIRFRLGELEIVLLPNSVQNAHPEQPHTEFSTGGPGQKSDASRDRKREHYKKLLRRMVSDEELDRLPD